MKDTFIRVDGYRATGASPLNLRKDTWSLALDQRVFGPGRLLVAFAKRSGLLVTIAYTRRSDPPEMALGPCIQHCGRGAAAAVALCDEAVAEGPPPPELAPRFAWARPPPMAFTWSTGSPATTSCSEAAALPSTPTTTGGTSHEFRPSGSRRRSGRDRYVRRFQQVWRSPVGACWVQVAATDARDGFCGDLAGKNPAGKNRAGKIVLGKEATF
jgi:hypothetical protein